MPVSNRTFGVELEVSRSRGRNSTSRYTTESEVADALRAGGVPAHYAGYTHATTADWKVVSDASVNNGFEIVSPILKGEESFAQIRKVSAILISRGLTVNKSCGLHVHVGVNDLTAKQLATVVKRYTAHEAKIDAFMAPSRRASANPFCQSMVHYAQNPTTADRLNSERRETVIAAFDNLGLYQRRYLKVNLSAWHRHQTLEFRQHQGTVEADKIINWVRFVLGFVDESIRRADGSRAPAPLRRVVSDDARVAFLRRFRRGSMSAHLAELLLTDAGVTIATAAMSTGLKEASISGIFADIRRKGFTIETLSNGRYKVVLPVTELPAEPAAINLPETPDVLAAGIDPDVFNFYKSRVRQFRTESQFTGADFGAEGV